MDVKTLLDNLKDEVSCSVCMTTFTEPKTLPCLYSFCLHCLNGILRTSGRHHAFLCPECRREVQVPSSGNLKDLPTNFCINSLLDVLAIKESHTTGVKCGNCDKSSRHSSYCFQCCAFWCDECITAHNMIKANKEHRVLALKDFEDQDIEDVFKRPAFCQQKHHEKEELKFFCKNCDVAICNSCVATIHDGHVKILLEEAASERKLQVESLIESQKEKIEQMKYKIAVLERQCNHIEARTDEVKRDINRFAENMTAAIETKRKEMLNKVETQRKESLRCVQTHQCEVTRQVTLVETAVEKTVTLLKRCTSAEIIQLDKSLNTVFPEEVSDDGKQAASDIEGLRHFRFTENKTLLDSLNSDSIGSFVTFVTKTIAHQSTAEGKGITEAIVGLQSNFLLTTRNTEGEQLYHERDCVMVEIKTQEGDDCATEVRVQDNKDGSYKIRYFLKDTGKCQLSVKANGEHIRGSPFNVEAKPRQFRPLLSFRQMDLSVAGTLNDPYGVAVYERDEILVTDTSNSRVQVFSSDGTYLRSFGRKGDKQGEFDFPTGIAYGKNKNIIVVDTDNHRVQFFNDQGEYLNQFGGKGNLDHQLSSAFGLSVDGNGNIIVADKGNKCIKTFSSDGQFLYKLGEGEAFTAPRHCIQYNKHLIESDSGEHCIKVFDINGDFLYKYGNKGNGDGQFNEPRFFLVDKAGHLMVCDRDNHRVQVFELSGKFVTKFGKRGNGPGEFYSPCCTAVLSDGRIVVADRSNSRIQILW
ncbi:E3 ubiquitin-protein ligase TRIM71-like isoform X1 [Stylophora pistillata]|uniref:E3 ubiquitin-protein ligase TRIM71-like isoform X1 n=1 Tax=Stylophora pistillata TaxID=50429 RepID=UPI000C039937|nr:E3 ubiquitin-protein ligase TRIM71-like isoform X1 [Stylophora pistillata]